MSEANMKINGSIQVYFEDADNPAESSSITVPLIGEGADAKAAVMDAIINLFNGSTFSFDVAVEIPLALMDDGLYGSDSEEE